MKKMNILTYILKIKMKKMNILTYILQESNYKANFRPLLCVVTANHGLL